MRSDFPPPHADLAAFLVTMRKMAKVFPVACTSPDNAGQMLSLHVDGARSGLNRERMAPGSKAEYVIAVPTKTLDSILSEGEAPAPTPTQGRWRIYGLGLRESILRKVYNQNAQRVLGLKLVG